MLYDSLTCAKMQMASLVCPHVTRK